MEECTSDNQAMQEKIGEILFALQAEIIDDFPIAKHCLDEHVDVTPPKKRPPNLGLVTIKQGGLKGAQSYKPGNIIVNWKSLLCSIPEFGVATDRLLGNGQLLTKVFALLIIVKKLLSHASVDLDRKQAVCLCAMWHRRESDDTIRRIDAKSACREICEVFQMPLPSDLELQNIFKDLETLKCIKEIDGVIVLCEKVNFTY